MDFTSFRKSGKADKPHYLLFGNPVGHSLSPLMHNIALAHHNINATYYAVKLLESELNQLAVHLNEPSFLGANVTIPHKQLIINYLDEIEPSAGKIEAVNTIVKKDDSLVGYNTDFDGFSKPLADMDEDFSGQQAILFGTGGASRAIVAALNAIGFEEIIMISRNPAHVTNFDDYENLRIVSYSQWTAFAENARLIVNATPLGMNPKVDESPVRDGEIEYLSHKICYDIVYNPLQTKFLLQAEQADAQTIGGLQMFIQQGNRSFQLWTGKSFPIKKIESALYESFRK